MIFGKISIIKFPKIDFGVCYEKAKENSNTKDNLIVVYAEKMGISNPNSTYSLYNPESGKKIDGESLCEQDWIIIEKNIFKILKIMPKFV